MQLLNLLKYVADITFNLCNALQFKFEFLPGFSLYYFQNDYFPPDWLPILQVVVGRIVDEGEETSILFQLLGTLVEAGNEHIALHIPYIISSLVGTISKCIPPTPEPWSQVRIYLLVIFIQKFLLCVYTHTLNYSTKSNDDDDEAVK